MVDWNVNISIVLTYVKIYTNASWRKVKTNEWHRTSQNTLFVDSPHVKTVAKRCAPSSTHRFREKTFIVSQNCFSLVFRFYFRLFSFIFRYLFTALLITCEQTININIKLLFWFSMPFDVQNYTINTNKEAFWELSWFLSVNTQSQIVCIQLKWFLITIDMAAIKW